VKARHDVFFSALAALRFLVRCSARSRAPFGKRTRNEFLTDWSLFIRMCSRKGDFELMARPKSEDKRNAIMEAATRVIASQGLSAPTALIAKEAGVSNGSLFAYFETKTVLLNQLYVELKTEMASSALDGLPTGKSSHDQMAYMWSGWLQWATTGADKRRTLAQLTVSDEITGASREIGHRAMAGFAGILDRSRENGPMRTAPLGLVVSLMNAVAEATVDFILHDPANADVHSRMGFEAMWRIIA
jgi:AcrR family transcriptional regulator